MRYGMHLARIVSGHCPQKALLAKEGGTALAVTGGLLNGQPLRLPFGQPPPFGVPGVRLADGAATLPTDPGTHSALAVSAVRQRSGSWPFTREAYMGGRNNTHFYNEKGGRRPSLRILMRAFFNYMLCKMIYL